MYSSKAEFEKEDELAEELSKIDEKLKELKNHYISYKLFASMGNENFVVYFEKVDIKDILAICQRLILDNNDILGYSYSTVLLRKISATDSKLIHCFDRENNTDIYTILCKQEGSKNIEDNLKHVVEARKNKEYSPKLYRLFGVFDYKIVVEAKDCDIGQINDLVKDVSGFFSDIQIEYQFGF